MRMRCSHLSVIIRGCGHFLPANWTLIFRKADDAVYQALPMETMATTRFAYLTLLVALLEADWASVDVIVLLDFAEWD